jgi:hypothetical protein
MINRLFQLLSGKAWIERMEYPDGNDVLYSYEFNTLTVPDNTGAQWVQKSAENYTSVLSAWYAFLSGNVEFMPS